MIRSSIFESQPNNQLIDPKFYRATKEVLYSDNIITPVIDTNYISG